MNSIGLGRFRIVDGALAGLVLGVGMMFVIEKFGDSPGMGGWLLRTFHKPPEKLLRWISDTYYAECRDSAMYLIGPVYLSYWLFIGALIGGGWCFVARRLRR